MSAGSHIADTIRTLLIGGTVAFLGYLGYTLLQARINNPPPQVVTMDDDNLKNLRADVAGQQRKLAQVAGLVERNDRRLNELTALQEDAAYASFPPGTVVEYGTVAFEKGRKGNAKKIRFRNTYASPPLIVASESGTAGGYPVVKAKLITIKDAHITVGAPQSYRCQVAYVVIGKKQR